MWADQVEVCASILEIFQDAQSLIVEKIRKKYFQKNRYLRITGFCPVCGSEFEVPAHATNLKVYCGPLCSMRMRNLRRRGPSKSKRNVQ